MVSSGIAPYLYKNVLATTGMCNLFASSHKKSLNFKTIKLVKGAAADLEVWLIVVAVVSF